MWLPNRLNSDTIMIFGEHMPVKASKIINTLHATSITWNLESTM